MLSLILTLWTLINITGIGSCGTWVVDPSTEVVIGIVAASSDELSLTWMVPAYPVFEDIGKRWNVHLTTENVEEPLA